MADDAAVAVGQGDGEFAGVGAVEGVETPGTVVIEVAEGAGFLDAVQAVDVFFADGFAPLADGCAAAGVAAFELAGIEVDFQWSSWGRVAG